MSITSSLSNAVSGLSAAARSAEIIAANVANANTEGYGRRELVLGANGVGGGVRMQGVTRVVNDVAIADRRLADASSGASSVALDFFKRMETVVGLPGDPGALGTTISALEADLLAASASPDNTAFLASVVASAKAVSSSINSIADEIKTARERADATIGSQIDQINDALQNIGDINNEIRRQTAAGGEVSGLLDQRQQQIDRVAEFIPVREVPRDHNQVALMTETGATLVDYNVARLVFQPTPVITPDMTLASGALSGLTIENAASSLGTPYQAIAGGALAANFVLRDEQTVAAQVQIDAVARNLIDRFADPMVDPTLAIGQAGLFTDAGADFDPLNEEGIASRLSVSVAVDPSQGGALAKLRDGIGSVAAGPTGENGVLVSMRSALSQATTPASGWFAGAVNFTGLGTELLSGFSSARQSAETNHAFNSSRATALKEIELQNGVSTDDELQRLLLIEQAYAANARVIQSVDEMMQSLLRI